MPRLIEHDQWPAQLQEPFGFLFRRGFRVIASSEYRLGQWAVLANDFAGVFLDGDADSQTFRAALVRMNQGQLPERWLIPQSPPVMLSLIAVAEQLAPASLRGLADLPPLRNQSDRLLYLEFWSDVLQAVATPWLDGDTEWFERTANQLSSPED